MIIKKINIMNLNIHYPSDSEMIFADKINEIIDYINCQNQVKIAKNDKKQSKLDDKILETIQQKDKIIKYLRDDIECMKNEIKILKKIN